MPIDKTITLAEGTSALIFDDQRVDIRQYDYISDRMINVSLTKQSIINLAEKIKENSSESKS